MPEFNLIDPLGFFQPPVAKRSRSADALWHPDSGGGARTGPETQSLIRRSATQREVNDIFAPANAALQFGAQGALELAAFPLRVADVMFAPQEGEREGDEEKKGRNGSSVQQERFRGPRA